MRTHRQRAVGLALCLATIEILPAALPLGACDGARLQGAGEVGAPADVAEGDAVGGDSVDVVGDVAEDGADEVACVPVDDAAFCASLGKDCDVVAGSDNCGAARSVDCGRCREGSVCGALALNVCDCPPETNDAFCTRLGRACGAFTAADNCGVDRTVASCGICRDGGFCADDGTCLGTCGDLGDASCCDDAGDALQCVSGALQKLDCPDANPCAWVQNFEVYSCGGQDGVDPAGSPISCAAYILPPECISESSAEFCARTGSECGDPPLLDNCGRLQSHDCGTCLGARQACNPLGQCTTCGDGVVERGEICDDGDLDDSDECTRECKWNGLCEDTCESERNGFCDDGGADAHTERCLFGSDCTDCGLRPDDACQGFPLGATCAAGPFEGLTTCSAPRGESYPVRGFTPCRERERCVAGSTEGTATCQLEPAFACRFGASECQGDTLRVCDAGAQWQATACAGACVPSALGSYCATIGGRSLSGTISYDFRVPNPELTDWGPVLTAPLGSARVVSLVRDGDAVAIYDVAVSAADGSYSVRIPDAPGAGDQVLVELARADGGGLRFAVGNPGLTPTGPRASVEGWLAGERGAVWSYAFSASAVEADPALHIDMNQGSGAAHVFAVAREVIDGTEALTGTPGAPLVVWLQPDVSWDCGACFAMVPTQLGDARAESAIWMSYDADEEHWSGPALAHELGHWAMASFGTATLEGGLHVRQPTLPGQAWNEGFATFFSSLARGDAVYSDKQSGSFWWADLGALAYSDGSPFVPATADARGYPDAGDPLLQQMDEFTLSATLWSVATAIGDAAPTLADQGRRFVAALASPRMNVVRIDPTARFQRGYVRHSWNFDGSWHIVDIVAHPAYSEPMLADYLDALRCPAATDAPELPELPDLPDRVDIDALVGAAVRDYPYPAGAAPLCQPAPAPPLTLALDGPTTVTPGQDLTLRLSILRPIPDRAPLTVSLAMPPGATLAGKSRELISDATSPVISREFHVRVTSVPKTDLTITVSARSPLYGVTARAAYRFGRPAPTVGAWPRESLQDRFGLSIARPIRVR